MRIAAITLALLALVAWMATPNIEQKPSPALPLLQQDLRAGEGLGDLRLGETTLLECIDRYGEGHAAVVFGDRYGIQVRYLGRVLVLDFLLSAEAQKSIPLDRLKDATRGLEDFARAQPLAAKARLQGIHVQGPTHHSDPTFTAGAGLEADESTVALGTPLHEVLECLGDPKNRFRVHHEDHTEDEPRYLLAPFSLRYPGPLQLDMASPHEDEELPPVVVGLRTWLPTPR